MKKSLLIFCAALAIVATGCKNKKKANTEMVEEIKDVIADIETSLGNMRIKLYGDTPRHQANFIKLANEGFYDGTLFHRVIKEFMIQGGDPLTKNPGAEQEYGTGGPGYQIPAEIRSNHRHKKGALAAARKGDAANPMRESSGSQFYIVQSENGCAHLDGQYTVFGEVIEGLEVIDRIAEAETDFRDRPLDNVKIVRVYIEASDTTKKALQTDSTAVIQ